MTRTRPVLPALPDRYALPGIDRDPIAFLVIGNTDTGKSTKLARAFCAGAGIGPEGGLQIAETSSGFSFRQRIAMRDRGPGYPKAAPADFEEMIAMIPGVANAIWSRVNARAKVGGYDRGSRVPWDGGPVWPSLIADDLSIPAKATLRKFQARYPNEKDIGRLWQSVYDLIDVFCEALKAWGLDLGLATHYKAKERERAKGGALGNWKAGGADLPGRQPTRTFAHRFDVATVIEATFLEAAAWPSHPTRFYCPGQGDPLTVTKDRRNVLTAYNPYGPANVREHLLASGIALPRIPGLEWQEEIAAEVAVRWLDVIYSDATGGKVPTRREIAESVFFRLGVMIDGSARSRQLQWAIEDGFDRAGYAARGVTPADDVQPPVTNGSNGSSGGDALTLLAGGVTSFPAGTVAAGSAAVPSSPGLTSTAPSAPDGASPVPAPSSFGFGDPAPAVAAPESSTSFSGFGSPSAAGGRG